MKRERKTRIKEERGERWKEKGEEEGSERCRVSEEKEDKEIELERDRREREREREREKERERCEERNSDIYIGGIRIKRKWER